MRATVAELLKVLPDFDDLMQLAGKISEISFKRIQLENEIKKGEADVFKRVFSDPSLWRDGKTPTISFIESTYKFTGVQNELLPLRNSLALITAELEKLRLQMEVYKQMLEVWRTQSANERASSL